MNRIDRHHYSTNTATKTSKSWTNREVVAFHYFNPNGLDAAKRINDDRISALVADDVIPSGWIIAYGSCATFDIDELRKLVLKKRVGRIEMAVCLEMLRDQVSKTAAKIEEIEEEIERQIEEQEIEEEIEEQEIERQIERQIEEEIEEQEIERQIEEEEIERQIEEQQS